MKKILMLGLLSIAVNLQGMEHDESAVSPKKRKKDSTRELTQQEVRNFLNKWEPNDSSKKVMEDIEHCDKGLKKIKKALKDKKGNQEILKMLATIITESLQGEEDYTVTFCLVDKAYEKTCEYIQSSHEKDENEKPLDAFLIDIAALKPEQMLERISDIE